MPARPEPATLEAWSLLLEAHHRLTDTLDREMRDRHGFGLDWYDVLYQLSAAGGSQRMHELAAATLFSRTDVTRLVDRMQRAGLVERRPDPEDRRGVHAVLTAAGRARLRRAAVTHLTGVEREFGRHVDPSDAAAMSRAFYRVLARS